MSPAPLDRRRAAATAQANSRRRRAPASMMRGRVSAAVCSHTRGASRMWVGPISRRSRIAVSWLSGKLTRIRHSSGIAAT